MYVSLELLGSLINLQKKCCKLKKKKVTDISFITQIAKKNRFHNFWHPRFNTLCKQSWQIIFSYNGDKVREHIWRDFGPFHHAEMFRDAPLEFWFFMGFKFGD